MTEMVVRHLEQAMRPLSVEAWRGDDPENMEPVEHRTIAEELDRVDQALGVRGRSMFAPLAEAIREAYVEVALARLTLLRDQPNGGVS